MDPERQAIADRLNTNIDLGDIKFRPVGGGKTAAYMPADVQLGHAK